MRGPYTWGLGPSLHGAAGTPRPAPNPREVVPIHLDRAQTLTSRLNAYVKLEQPWTSGDRQRGAKSKYTNLENRMAHYIKHGMRVHEHVRPMPCQCRRMGAHEAVRPIPQRLLYISAFGGFRQRRAPLRQRQRRSRPRIDEAKYGEGADPGSSGTYVPNLDPDRFCFTCAGARWPFGQLAPLQGILCIFHPGHRTRLHAAFAAIVPDCTPVLV